MAKETNRGQTKKAEAKKVEEPKPELNHNQQVLLDSYKAFQAHGVSSEAAAQLACTYYEFLESNAVALDEEQTKQLVESVKEHIRSLGEEDANEVLDSTEENEPQ